MKGMGCWVFKQNYGKGNDVELTFLILNHHIQYINNK